VHVPLSGAPHWPCMPPPPQVSGLVQVPQSISLPHPSPAMPHDSPCSAHVIGSHVDAGGVTQDAKSKIMYSRIFSCALNVFVHSCGNGVLLVFVSLAT
jgi:hypothetical protein